MAVMTTGSFPKELRPGVFAFTQLTYDEHKSYLPLMFAEQRSDMSYEEGVSGNTFGLVPSLSEGSNIQYAQESQANTTRSTHVFYAMGYAITLPESMQKLYEKLGKRRGARLAMSFNRTRETVGANVFNRAHNTSYTFGDAKALCVTTHPSLNGDWSNRLTVAVDMSEASVEDLCILIRKATDNVGNKIGLQPKRMMYAPDEKFNATRFLESELQADSAQNNINALKSNGMIPEHFDNPYLDDADSFFVMTDIGEMDGLLHFKYADFKPMYDTDSNTLNEKHFGFEAYSFSCFDARAVFSNGGGA